MLDYSVVQFSLGMLFSWQFFILFVLYFTDKKLKLYSKLGLRNVNMHTLTKCRYFFVYYKRKEGIITRRAFVCMIAYYIVNIIGCLAILVQFIIVRVPYMADIIFYYLVSHVGLFAAAMCIRKLDDEQEKVFKKYEEEERERRKEEKRKLSL